MCIRDSFGLELDPRFVDSMQLITGSLPAQYGARIGIFGSVSYAF